MADKHKLKSTNTKKRKEKKVLHIKSNESREVMFKVYFDKLEIIFEKCFFSPFFTAVFKHVEMHVYEFSSYRNIMSFSKML